MKDRLFEIWFALACGQANTEFQPLLEQYGTPYDLFNADEREIEKLPCSPRLKRALCQKSLQQSQQIMEFCKHNHIGILFWQDKEYPATLRPLRDPPVLLYYIGDLPDLSRRLCISLVGTRTMSEYGKRMAYKIGYELAATGTVVVSGMALGNDSVATAGALAAGGQVVAVLGCGVDVVYPANHDLLREEILHHGVVISEYPPGTRPVGAHFPVRNRIISGLSQGPVVIEGDLRSGALITAKTAILQGRDIYAFPGNVGETNAAGTNQLISDGAAMVLRARDVLDNYAFLYRDTLHMSRLATAEKNSEPDNAVLARLGVCARPSSPPPAPGDAAPPPPEPPARKSRKENTKSSPKKSSRPSLFRSRRTAEPMDEPPVSQTKQPSGKNSPTKTQRPTTSSPVGDTSRRALESLTPTQRGVFDAIPLDHAVPIDYLTREGFSMSDIMASMTILEIKGLVVTLPGGLYSRK